jgi:hypothetical protein
MRIGLDYDVDMLSQRWVLHPNAIWLTYSLIWAKKSVLKKPLKPALRMMNWLYGRPRKSTMSLIQQLVDVCKRQLSLTAWLINFSSFWPLWRSVGLSNGLYNTINRGFHSVWSNYVNLLSKYSFERPHSLLAAHPLLVSFGIESYSNETLKFDTLLLVA